MRNRTALRSLGFFPMICSRLFNSAAQVRSKSRSRLNMLQRFPVFKCPAEMRDNNGSTNKGGDAHGLVHLLGRKSYLLAFSEVIFYAVVAAEYERARKSNHFFCPQVEGALLICVCIEVENAFDDQAVRSHNLFIHTGAICVEFFRKSHGQEFMS